MPRKLDPWMEACEDQRYMTCLVLRRARPKSCQAAEMLINSRDRSIPVTVQARSRVAPAHAFQIVVPIDLAVVFTRWGPFPGVRGASNQSGSWDAVGRTRNPDLTDGSTAQERITEYTAPSSFAYEITEFTNVLDRLVEGVQGEWTFTPDGEGTLVRWTYEFKPRPGRELIMQRLIAPLWHRAMSAAMRRTITVIHELDPSSRL